MNLTKRPRSRCALVLACLLGTCGSLGAADGLSADEIAQLKAQIAAQQKQLEALQSTIAAQQKMLDAATSATPATPAAKPVLLGEVASLTPIIPQAPANPTIPLVAQKTGQASANPCEVGYEGNAVPPYLRLGSVCIQPVGFMDLTMVWRDKNAGSSIGTNFGSIPYNTTNPQSKLSEFRFSPQNSRIGFRIDGDWKGAHFIGYNEFDFLSSATPGSADVSNGAFVPRLRLFWVDVRKRNWEFLGGQSWSMLVPNRTGISALPSDLFYSQVIDVNYVAGLPWTRQPGFRVLYHTNDNKATFGVSFEEPTQYSGGSAGGSPITLPAALTSLNGSQLDNTSGNVLSTPNLMPDIIAKIAFDPGSRVHFEFAGIMRAFKIWNPTITTSNTYSTTFTGGGAFNGNFEVVKGLRLVTNNFVGPGVGRYLFGQAPDLVVTASGTIKPLKAGGFVEGFELTKGKSMFYGYFGDIYIQRYVVVDADGKTLVGYGYRGAPNSQNRNLQEITVGFNQTLWKDPKWGAINFMGQYMYMLRYPWYLAPNAPKSAHDNTIYLNLRYTLPGSMPKF